MATLQLGLPRRKLAPARVPDSKDRIVQQTDQDASQARLSAVEAGYLEDGFAKAFVTSKSDRRYPLINRGTFVRTTALDVLIHRFLGASEDKKQIVSLGAGSDTRYFRLKQKNVPGSGNVVYHEFDFTSNTKAKVAAIQRNSELKALAGGDEAKLDQEAGSLLSPQYHIHPLDIRSLKPGCEVPQNIDPSLPTLFLSECCLIYLAPEEADAILKWATHDFSSFAAIIIYEPIGGHDSFGQVMIQNLLQRGIVLKTLLRYPTLDKQKERLCELGFSSGQRAVDVNFIHDSWVGEEERVRISQLEMMDEVEEWQLLAKHYCIAWGWRGDSPDLGKWADGLPLQEVVK